MPRKKKLEEEQLKQLTDEIKLATAQPALIKTERTFKGTEISIEYMEPTYFGDSLKKESIKYIRPNGAFLEIGCKTEDPDETRIIVIPAEKMDFLKYTISNVWKTTETLIA